MPGAPLSSATLKAGDVLDGIRIDAPLGEGGAGSVYRAEHPEHGTVAVKVLREPERLSELSREWAAIQRIPHPGVVQLHALHTDRHPAYLVCELVEGKSLRQRLEQQGRLSWEEAWRITEDTLEILAAAHGAGVVHGDLKPENILLQPDGRARLTDFGLARQQADASQLAVSQDLHTQLGAQAGTVAYLAPEQRHSDGEVDARVDCYAMGIILFEMLTGERPQGTELPGEVAPGAGIPVQVDDLFRQLYARKEVRPGDAGAALSLLARHRLTLAATPTASDGDRLVGREEAVRMLGIGLGELDRLVRQGVLKALPGPANQACFAADELESYRRKELGIPGRLATARARAAAFAADLVLAVSLGLVIANDLAAGPVATAAITGICFAGLTILGHLLMGRTLGERLAQVRPLRQETGAELGPLRAGARSVLLWLGLAPAGLGLLGVLTSRRRQGVHDILTNTVVIRNR